VVASPDGPASGETQTEASLFSPTPTPPLAFSENLLLKPPKEPAGQIADQDPGPIPPGQASFEEGAEQVPRHPEPPPASIRPESFFSHA
jgi:hypothetical protein